MRQERKHIVDILFVLALFAVFTISALVLVTIGADVYQHTVKDMSHNYELRTSTSYLTEKLRQNDILIDGEGISCTTLFDQPALMFPQEIEGTSYCTYVYLYEGQLKELFMKQGSFLGTQVLAAGQNIMELSDFSIAQINDQLLSIEMTNTDGSQRKVYVSTHCTP